jgi:hypothetical protein
VYSDECTSRLQNTPAYFPVLLAQQASILCFRKKTVLTE